MADQKNIEQLIEKAKKDPELQGVQTLYDPKLHRQPIHDNNGKVVGFFTPREDKNGWRMGAVFVDPAYRKQGHATRAAKAFFSDKNMAPVPIRVGNTGSESLFRQLGFTPSKRPIGDDEWHGRWWDPAASKTAALQNQSIPPEPVREAARKGLEYRRMAGGKGGLSTQEAGRQGIGSGVARAQSLARGQAQSPETIKRMVAFFSRHNKNVDLKEKYETKPYRQRGYVAGLLWGGRAGETWARGELTRQTKKMASVDPTDKNAWISAKIRTLHDEGRPHDQAIAIAYSMWDKMQNKDKGKLKKTAAIAPHITLQQHQAEAAERAKDPDRKGDLLYWGLGSGKTIGSQAIAEARGGPVLVVVPAALRNNYRSQLSTSVTADRHKDYHIVSYEALRKDPEGLVDKVKPNTVLVDEFQRARNPGPREPFERIRDKVPYLVGMTGSPISNHPEEIVPLVNLTAGKKVFDSQEGFRRDYIKEQAKSRGILGALMGAPKQYETVAANTSDFKKRIEPHISVFQGNADFEKNMPAVKKEVVEVPMSSQQERLYRYLEGSDPLTAMRVRWNMPMDKKEKDLKALNAFSSAARQIANDPGTFDKNIKDDPYKRFLVSPKLRAAAENVAKEHATDPSYKTMFFSNYLDAGVVPLAAGLERHHGLSVNQFKGSMNDKEKDTAVKDFNEGKVPVLGISPAGAEGLDLKGVRQIPILDEHWNPERSKQVIGRGARFRSHAALPEDKRNLTVKRYISVFPDSTAKKVFRKITGAPKPMTADQYIKAQREQKEQINDQFYAQLKSLNIGTRDQKEKEQAQ